MHTCYSKKDLTHLHASDRSLLPLVNDFIQTSLKDYNLIN